MPDNFFMRFLRDLGLRVLEFFEFIGDLVFRLYYAVRSQTRSIDESDHKRASGYLERGRVYYNKKRYEKAEHYFRKSIDRDPQYALAHYYLGLALYRKDDSSAAVRAWNRAKEVEPGSDAAAKADKKLDYVKGHMVRVINDLEERIRH